MDIQDQTKVTTLTLTPTPSGTTLIHSEPLSDDDGLHSDKEKNPNATKLLDTQMEVKEQHDNLEILDINNANTQFKLSDSDTKTSVSLGEDQEGSHKDHVMDTFEVSDNKDQGEEEVYVLSVPSDIPVVDHAETLIDDFKDPKIIYSNVPHGEKDAENISIVDSLEVITAEENIQESQTSKHTISDLSAFVPIFSEESTDNLSESKDKQKIAESVVFDPKHSGKVGISERLEKAEQLCDVSGVVSETLVDESVGSSSRNSVEGNWGSVSVLSTASIDAENAHSIGKSDISADKSRLGKSYAFENSSLVESIEEIVDEKTSEIKVQNTQPPKPEANVSNQTEGRKRNEEAIAKVTNWSTGENTNAPLKNLLSEAKSSNPKPLSTMIQKDEPAEKIGDPEKSIPVNQDPSPPKYISEGEKVRKKPKGRASWVSFVCCSSVNGN